MERYHRSFSLTFRLGGEVDLRINSKRGDIRVRSHDIDTVEVRGTAELYAESAAEADAQLETIEQSIQASGNRLTIATPDLPKPTLSFFGRGARIDYEVIAPRHAHAEIEQRNGRCEIEGLRGPLEIRNHNGSVRAEKIAQAISVESHNGRAQLVDCSGTVDVVAHNGVINVEQLGGDARIEAHNGAISAREVAGKLSLTSHNGTVRYTGAVLADMDIHSHNGPIRLEVPLDSRFEIDAETRRGTVRSDLPVNQDGATDGSRPLVRLRSANGSIRILPL